MKTVLACLAALLPAALVWAVQPVTTTHTTEEDFLGAEAAAEVDSVVVWSLGEVTLGRETQKLLEGRKDVDMVSALAIAPDGTTYVGTAAEGLVLRIDAEGNVEQLADLEGVVVTSLLLQGERLLAATAGGRGGVYEIDPAAEGAVRTLWAGDPADPATADPATGDPATGDPATGDPATGEAATGGPATGEAATGEAATGETPCGVWALASYRGMILAATDKSGELVAIDAEGKAKVIFSAEHAKQKLLRSIAVGEASENESENGFIVVGTADEGLVYRLDPNGGQWRSRVLLDAREKEIVGVAVAADGSVYVAATDVTTAPPSPPAKTDDGKPLTRPATAPAAETTMNDAPTRCDPATGDPAMSDPAMSDPAMSDPATGDPAMSDPAMSDPAMSDPAMSDPAMSDPAMGDPAMSDPATGDPATGDPAGEDAADSRPQGQELTEEAEADEAAAEEPMGDESAGDEPLMEDAQAVPPTQPAGPLPSTAMPRRAPSRRPPGEPKGNTVYRIGADGLVTVVARLPQTLYGMTLVRAVFPGAGERIILATDGGRVVEIDPATGAAGAVATLDAKKVTAVAAGRDLVAAGTTDAATVVRIGRGLATSGTLTSEPIDAEQIARWGSVSLTAEVPPGASVTLAARTGNTAEPIDETWSDWSPEITAADAWAALDVPAGRFAQYRLTLARGEPGDPAKGDPAKGDPAKGKGDPAMSDSPTVDAVSLVHQVGNLAPEVESVTVTPSAQPQKSEKAEGPRHYRIVAVKADDANGDSLRYTLYYRLRGGEVWIKLAEELTKGTHAWDTRTAPDGVYEIKVEATDEPDNPPASALADERVSRAVIVDNTPPAIAELTARVADGKVTLAAALRDANRIGSCEYVVDSAETAVVLAAEDGIFDEAAESVAAVIEDIEPGPHVITLRATDEFENASYAAVTVSVAE